ncbi:MAG: triose-phosphate isomerase [Candidatus Diapherotrites archaeon]|nr:triose-phosphate isomerase [Candidatus Diapherotrites archaeon]
MLGVPCLFVNFKTYSESTGRNALALAKAAERVSLQSEHCVCVVPQAADLRLVSENVSIPVFCQHVDAIRPGAHTGQVLAEAVKEAGASGTVLNHAERKIDAPCLAESISIAKGSGLNVLACAETVERAGAIASLASKPDLIAFEPPELIGGNVSVSTAKPDLIAECVEAVSKHGIPLLVGAGVKSAEDVRVSMELGAKGIFVASGVIKVSSPEAAMLDLVSGF